MKKLNKLLSFVIALSMVLSVMVVTPTSVGATTTANEEVLKFLQDFGIYDPDAEIDLAEPVSRADFAKMASKLVYLGEPSEIVEDEIPFVDITNEEESYSAVQLLCKMGFVKGTDSTHFEPFSYIEPEHALIILVKIMGYDYLAQNKGSYFAAAQDKKLLNRVGFSYSDKLTYAEAYNLIYNAFNADISDYNEIDGRPDGNKKETLLYKRHNIATVSGTISDDGMTSLYGESSILKDEISVQYDGTNEITLKCSDAFKADALGKKADVYYKENAETGDYEVVSLCQIENRNNVVKINPSYIVKLETETDGGYLYTYYIDETDEDNELEASVSSEHKLIYNGKAYDSNLLPEGKTYIDLLKPELGVITLIDNDGDDYFDIVSVYDYETFVVGSVNPTDKIIYSQTSVGQPKIDLSSKSLTYTLSDEKGESVSLSDFGEYAILSVAKSLDGKMYDIKVSKKSITGTVSEKTTDKIVVSGGEFKIVYPKKNGQDVEYLATAGTTGTFYFDVFGNIAYVKSNSLSNDDVIFGYVNVYGVDSKRLTDTLTIKMFTSRGIYKDYKLAQKVTIDGVKYKDYNEMLTALDRGIRDINGDKVSPLIRIKLDDDNMVYWVDTCYEGQRESESIVKLDVSGTKRYFSRSIAFSGDIGVASDSVIFNVPDTNEEFDPEKASIVTRTGLVDNKEVNLTAYCVGDSAEVKTSLTADVFVCEASQNLKFEPNIQSNKFGIVTGVSQAYDKDKDEIIYKVTINENGVPNEVYTKDPTDIEFEETGEISYKGKIEKGDLILYLLGADGKLTADSYKVVYDANKQSQDENGDVKMGYFSSTTASLDQWRATVRIAYDTVYNYKDNLFQVSSVEPNQIPRLQAKDLNLKIYGGSFNNQGAVYLRYDQASNKVTKISAQDLKTYVNVGTECDKAFYRAYYGTLQTVIIYDKE